MNTQQKVRVALIGAGDMANSVHYPSLAEFTDVEMAGLCDVDEDKLRATSDKFHIPQTFTNYKKMLDQIEPQAVYILMPPHHLFDLVMECLGRKLHVFIEKPPGITTEQTRNMARLAEKNGCLTMVGFQRRFCPLLIEARRRVEERDALVQCLARFVKSGMVAPYYGGAVDILTSDVIHAVDMLRWMGGDVKKLASTVNSFHAEINNAFNALVEFESGAVGMLLSNFVVGRRIYAVEMHAYNISAYAEPDDKAIFYKDNHIEGETLRSVDAAQSGEMHKYLGFFGENRHFIDCIQQGKQPHTNFMDAVKTMELVDKIYHSQL